MYHNISKLYENVSKYTFVKFFCSPSSTSPDPKIVKTERIDFLGYFNRNFDKYFYVNNIEF